MSIDIENLCFFHLQLHAHASSINSCHNICNTILPQKLQLDFQHIHILEIMFISPKVTSPHIWWATILIRVRTIYHWIKPFFFLAGLVTTPALLPSFHFPPHTLWLRLCVCPDVRDVLLPLSTAEASKWYLVRVMKGHSRKMNRSASVSHKPLWTVTSDWVTNSNPTTLCEEARDDCVC